MYPLIMNEAIQQQWADIGIDAEFRSWTGTRS
jgi:hypothetical protein